MIAVPELPSGCDTFTSTGGQAFGFVVADVEASRLYDARMASQCLISFGSNLGQRESLLADAARRVAASGLASDFFVSRLFQTPPIGGPGGQEPFLNAVAAFETEASARKVLNFLQATELDLGRLRNRRWDSRSIDLDVVLHGDLVGGDGGLVVPHPRYPARRFVLMPALDVAAHYRDPRFGWTLGELAEHVEHDQPSLALVGGDQELRRTLCDRLHREHGIATFVASSQAARIDAVANAPVLPTESRSPIECVSDSFDPPASPWVCDFLPAGMGGDSGQWIERLRPRLIARIQRVTPDSAWPAPHQMWPKSWRYPEYRLEVEDIDWAVAEVASAITSMRCPCDPVTDDGDWWKESG